MPVAKLRKVGGSVMVAIPRSVLDEAKIGDGSSVDVSVDAVSGAIALRPTRPRYRLADLLAAVDPAAVDTEEDRAWIDGPPVGREMI